MTENIGVYRIIGIMGEGGTGRVYRAVQIETNEVVALKLPLGKTPHEREALRREAAMLRRLSRFSHPGVVSLLAAGTQAGTPWYAMEYVDGGDLGSYLADQCGSSARLSGVQRTLSRTDGALRATVDASALALAGGMVTSRVAPAPAASDDGSASGDASSIEQVLRLIAAVADALDLVHGEGIVHGDVSPRNVIVRTAVKTPVLIDFGHAFRAHHAGLPRDVAHATSALGGTPAYMAPERFSRALPDARVDLYALGCVLYELLAGRPPFSGATVHDLMRQHTTRAPQPLSSCARDVPPELDRLVAGLLAKDPIDRPGRAGEVAHALRAILGEESRPTPPRTPALYRARFLGRDDELRTLTSRLHSVLQGDGGVAWVAGEGGVGKTRLLNEMGMRAAGLGFRVISSQCGDPVHVELGARIANVSLEPLVPLLEQVVDACTDPDQHALLFELRENLAILRPYASVPCAALELPAPPAQLSPDLAIKRVLRALAQIAIRFSREAPLLLIIDDVHRADELTARFLRDAAAAFARSRVLVLCALRGGGQAPQVLGRMDLPADVTLAPLPPLALRRFAKDLLSTTSLPEGLSGYLERHSEGNPLFAAEYLRTALARGLLRSSAAGGWTFTGADELAVPASLGELLSERLANLSFRARVLLDHAAILGREFSTADLADELEDLEADALDELVARQVLEWCAAGRYRFTHDQLRDLHTSALSLDTRRLQHRRAAERMERHGAASPDREARLGIHWRAAGEPARALDNLERAARAAFLAHAPSRAAELYRLAIEQCTMLQISAPEAFRVRLAELAESRADMLVLLAAHQEARAAYLQAAAQRRSHERLERARLHRKLATSFWTLHEYAPAEEHLDCAARALSGVERDSIEENRERIEVEIGRLECLYFSGRVGPESERIFRELEPSIERHASAAQRLRYYVGAASSRFAAGRYAFDPGVLALAGRALPKDTSDLPLNELALARFMLGFVRITGDLDRCREALDHFSDALSDARLAGDNTLLSRVLVYRLFTLVRLRDVASVRDELEEVASVTETAQLPPYVAVAQAVRAWLAWRAGDRERAHCLAEDARAIWRTHPHPFPFQWLAVFPLLDVHKCSGAFDDVHALLPELLAQSQQRLPEELRAAVQGCSAGWAGRSDRDTLEMLEAVLDAARRHHYC